MYIFAFFKSASFQKNHITENRKSQYQLLRKIAITLIIAFLLEGFHFTDCKNYDTTMSLFLVIVRVIDAFHESFAIVYFIRQGPC